MSGAGISHIRLIEQGLCQWMEEREYESVGQMRSSMSQIYRADPGEFERAEAGRERRGAGRMISKRQMTGNEQWI